MQGAASLPPRKRGEERSLARLWREGNPPEADERRRTCPCESRDDALMVDQGLSKLWIPNGLYLFILSAAASQ